MAGELKVCPICNKEFIAKAKSRIYCYPVYGEYECGKNAIERLRYKKIKEKRENEKGI